MEELVSVLQTYGGWGISVVMMYACQRLYRDLRETEQKRLEEAIGYADRLYASLNDAVKLVESIHERPSGE